MAEARQAVAFQFAVTSGGIKVEFNKDAVKSAGRALLSFARVRYLVTRNEILRGIFPASPFSLMGITGLVSATYYRGLDPTLGVSEFLVNSVRKIGLGEDYIPVVSVGVVVCEVVGLWVIYSYLQRSMLRSLLSYHGWMFDQHGSQSWSTRLWGTAVKLLTMFTRPRLYSYQSSMPRLPVPALKDTCKRFLSSVRPLLDDNDYSEMETLVANFQAGPGRKIQRYLVLKSWWANNYVTDWWEKYVYLHGRSSLMINSNYYACDMVDNPKLATSPVIRAAVVSSSIMLLKRDINRGNLKPLLVMGIIPLCSFQFERAYGTTRRPGQTCDQLLHFSGAESNYCVCWRAGRWYKVALTYPNGRIYSSGEMEKLFQMVFDDVDMERREGVRVKDGEEHLAALTALEREKWAEVYEEHFTSGRNQVAMETIEKAAYILIFDDKEPVTIDKDGCHSGLSDYCKDLMHGTGHTRWFDKSMTQIIYANGKVGINAEHSWADAPIVGYAMEYYCNLERQIHYVDGHCEGYADKSPHLTAPTRLEWDLSPACVSEIESACIFAQEKISNLQLCVVRHDEFGKGVMKQCGISPDAFIQMALQLAYYKDAGKFCLTYEASMTRLFLEGRTETVRSVSSFSTNFVRAMCDKHQSFSIAEKKALLIAATDHHVNSYKLAMLGKGIDRHLFCLYVMSKYLKMESPFLNKVLKEPWRLSTSQTPSQQTGKINFNIDTDHISPGGGFGPVAEDGYGVSYIIQGDYIIYFHVASFESSKDTDPYRFAGLIKDSLREIKDLFNVGAASGDKK